MPPTAPDHIALPFELLLQRLEAAGFRLDPSRRLRLLRALDEQGHQFVGKLDDLKYLIAPIVSRSAAEQRKVYEVFEAFLAESAPVVEQVFQVKKEIKAEKPAEKRKTDWKQWWWVLPLAGMLFITYKRLETWIFPAPEQSSISIFAHFSAPPLYEDSLSSYQAFSTRMEDSSLIHWEVQDLSTGRIDFRDSMTHTLVWKAHKAGQRKRIRAYIPEHLRKNVGQDTLYVTVQCPNPPPAPDIQTFDKNYVQGTEYAFRVPVPQGYKVDWSVYNAEVSPLENGYVGIRFLLNGPQNIRARVYYPDTSAICYTERSLGITVGNEKPVLAYAGLYEDTPVGVLPSNPGWIWAISSLLVALGLCAPLLIAVLLFKRWEKSIYKKIPEKTAAELEPDYPIHDAGPYFIPYQPQEQKITVPRDFFRVADILRRREADVRTYFDAPATVRATIDTGGFPSWREKALTRPTDYLFLVTRSDERDQQGRLFERLTAFMLRRDVPVAVFFHDGYFTRFWNGANPEGVDLHSLRGMFPNHRLVLLGSGHGLVDAYATQQPALYPHLLRELSRWQRRLLLSPEPLAAWSFQEALLHRHFVLFPADTEGMLAGFDLLDRTEENQPGRFERWVERLHPHHSTENHRYRNWATVQDHEEYLAGDPELFRWLCALSVCVQPDWALTLAVGRAVGVEVTHDRLLQLTRIPWLSANQPNDTLRLELLKRLDADTERRAREAVAEELDAAREQSAGSFADTERRSNLAVHQFALNPRDENTKQTLRELRTLGLLSGSQLAELDHIVRERADKKGRSSAAVTGIDGWLAELTPQPEFNAWMAAGIICLGGFIIGIFLTGNYCRTNSFQQAATNFWSKYFESDIPSEAFDLNNLAVQQSKILIDSTTFDNWHDRRDTYLKIDSLFQRAINLRVSGYPLAARNSHALYYNVAAKNFNYYLDDPVKRTSDLQLADEIFGITEVLKRNSPDVGLLLHTWHGRGLSSYYLSSAPVPLTTELISSAKGLGWPQQKASDPSTRDELVKAAEQFVQNAPVPVIPENHRDTAIARYNRIVARNPQYFDSLEVRMPVNLKSLLFPGPPKPFPGEKNVQSPSSKKQTRPKTKVDLMSPEELKRLIKKNKITPATKPNGSQDLMPPDSLFKNLRENDPQNPAQQNIQKNIEPDPKEITDSSILSKLILKPSGKNSGAEEKTAPETPGGDKTWEDVLTDAFTGPIVGGDLRWRAVTSKPRLEDAGDKQGKVVVSICVNAYGDVISAEYSKKGSTTSDRVLINKAVEAARQFKFAATKEDKQCGEMSFDFKKK